MSSGLSVFVRLSGLCVAYAAFSYAVDAAKSPLQKCIDNSDGTPMSVLAALLAEFGSIAKSFGGSVGKSDARRKEGKSKASAKESSRQQTTLYEEEVVLEDLCSKCKDGWVIVHRLMEFSCSMGIEYPGEPFQPCKLCLERRRGLSVLERSFGASSPRL